MTRRVVERSVEEATACVRLVVVVDKQKTEDERGGGLVGSERWIRERYTGRHDECRAAHLHAVACRRAQNGAHGPRGRLAARGRHGPRQRAQLSPCPFYPSAASHPPLPLPLPCPPPPHQPPLPTAPHPPLHHPPVFTPNPQDITHLHAPHLPPLPTATTTLSAHTTGNTTRHAPHTTHPALPPPTPTPPHHRPFVHRLTTLRDTPPSPARIAHLFIRSCFPAVAIFRIVRTRIQNHRQRYRRVLIAHLNRHG